MPAKVMEYLIFPSKRGDIGVCNLFLTHPQPLLIEGSIAIANFTTDKRNYFMIKIV